jgi:hypothetical protein
MLHCTEQLPKLQKEEKRVVKQYLLYVSHSQRMCWIHILKMQYKPNEKVKAVQKIKFQILYQNNDRLTSIGFDNSGLSNR